MPERRVDGLATQEKCHWGTAIRPELEPRIEQDTQPRRGHVHDVERRAAKVAGEPLGRCFEPLGDGAQTIAAQEADDLLDGGVEGKCAEDADTPRPPYTRSVDGAVQSGLQVRHAAMWDHDALGLPSRPRCIDDVGQIRWTRFDPVDRDTFHVGNEKLLYIDRKVSAQTNAGACFFQDVVDAGGGPARVERHIGASALPRRDDAHDGLDPGGQAQSHGFAVEPQLCCERRSVVVELSIGELSARRRDRWLIGTKCDGSGIGVCGGVRGVEHRATAPIRVIGICRKRRSQLCVGPVIHGRENRLELIEHAPERGRGE